MTNHSQEVLEAKLHDCYQAQVQHYRKALAIAKELPEAFSSGAAPTEKLKQLSQRLDEVARLEGMIAEVKQNWRHQQYKPGTRLQATLDTTEALLSELLPQISRAEQLARDARQNLHPRLSDAVQSTRMRNAYRSAEQCK